MKTTSHRLIRPRTLSVLLSSFPLCVPVFASKNATLLQPIEAAQNDPGPQENRSKALSQAHTHDHKVATLPPVVVKSKADASSEGSNRYAAPYATIGSKEPVPVIEIPNSVSVITRQRIEDQGLFTAEDALRQVTGVTVTPWDGATSQIRSRGYFLEPSYDGIPSYSGLNATQQFDTAMFDRIEVLRGPAGLYQGSGQPGGTVNFVRRQGLAKFGGSAAVSAGTWNNYRAEASVGGPLNEDGSLRSRLVLVTQDRGFYYDRAKSSKEMVYGTLDYDLSPATTISIYGAYQDDTTNPFSGLPAYTNGRFIDAPRSTNPYPSWSVYKTTTSMFAVDAEHRFDNDWKLRGRYSYNRQDWGLRDSYPTTGINPLTGTATYARRGWDSESKRDLVDVYATGPFSLLGRQHALTVGWNYTRYTSDTDYAANDTIIGVPFLSPNLVPSLPVPPYVRNFRDETVQYGVYAQARWSLTDSVTLITGARTTDFNVRSRNTPAGTPTPAWTQGAHESGEVTPFAGLVVHLTKDITAYTSYSDIFMPQTQRTVSGTILAPRVGKQMEYGLKGSFADGRLQTAVAMFETRDRNRAFPDAANPGSFVQVGEVQVKGWEAEVSGSPIKDLNMTVGYARLDTEYLRHQTLQGTAFTLFEPRHTFKAYANYRLAGTPWSIGGGAQIVSGSLGSGQSGVREAGGYGTGSLQVAYHFDERTSLSLAVNNVFDREYYARVGGLNSYNTYGDPRNAMLTLRTKF